MDIIKAHATNNLCYTAGQKMTPQGIVIHSTGANNPNLKRYVDAPDEVGVNSRGNHFNNPMPSGKKVCVHAFVGYDKDKNLRVAEILPLDICAWGVGNGKLGSYNFDPAYIQIEICEDSLENESYYKDAFALAAEYCAKLCEEFSIKNENIVGHNEAHKRGYASNHSDPEHWMKKFGESMDVFRARVAAILESEKEKKYAVVLSNLMSREVAEKMLFSAKAAGFEDALLVGDIAYTQLDVEDALRAGDKVKIRRGARAYDGVGLASFVYDRVHTVAQISGDRVVVSYNGKIVAAVRETDLERIE